MIRFFRHYISTSMLILMLVEFLVFFLTSHFSADRHGLPPASLRDIDGLYKALLFASLLTLFSSMFDLYGWAWTTGLKSLFLRVLACFLIAGSLIFLGSLLLPVAFASGLELLSSLVISCLSVVLIRLLFVEWDKLDLFKKRVLVLGTGSRAAKIEELASQGKAQGLNIIGYLPMGAVHSYVPHDRVLTESASISDLVDQHGITEIVVAIRERRGGGLPVSDLLECKLRGVSVLDLPAFFERQTGILPLEAINASWMIFSDGFSQGVARDVVKRMFDLFVSGLLLLCTLPIMLLTGLSIRLESRGPIFYTQERVGQYGNPFTIYKFRSMYTDAEKDGRPVWAAHNDDRTTRVGRLIRRLRIDELPQTINVFLVQMSFVGPRPERSYFVDELAAQIPYFHARHSVKPGITGWAQVCFPYGASVEDAMSKLQYDLYYVKNHSLFLDLMILLQTAQVVVLGKGVR
ncbi:MAG: TIGR03013 family PEP-CTERM/XrtA system glycosyltransferase [Pseudomonadota bacterium]|nr:TIGR03013 family PEP-CTERM/XrtA system glycosyltransferase [Pseudomonadota bacterium]